MIEFFFWFIFGLLFYSYFIFPQLLRIISKHKQKLKDTFFELTDLPTVSVIVSVYNEQDHIAEKITNILNCDYPINKLELIIGSDGSNDQTNAIIASFANTCSILKPLYFSDRRGKSAVINDCVAIATGEILILTDAKATLKTDAIKQMLRKFQHPHIGIVGATIINKNAHCKGIAHQESTFMSQEIKVKYNEGNAFGCCIGVYGACYAIRKELIPKVPLDFAVDDFYISMKVLEKRYDVILDSQSICYENVTSRISEEFRRKIRIGVGNIQNLGTFAHLLFRFNAVSFCFFSHKIIRWLGPFFLIALFILSCLLWHDGTIYRIFVLLQVFNILASVIDFYLKKIHLQIIILRFITHFYTMNLALLIGFFKYLIGVKANVWEPTNR
ncbi:MAG TPA: glycosyltransferase [Bacteroidales bacterium]|nr:glycosyltransferase [Bacteroidales bacterium]